MNRLLFIALFATTVVARAHAHDFWIEPSSYRPSAGETVLVALRVGEHFTGDPVPRMSSRIESFVVRDSGGERAVEGSESEDPAGLFALRDGPAVIGYRGNFARVELPRAKFEQYLREEGLENRIRVRGDGIQRERYARFVKSIVGGSSADEPFGWRFELVTAGASRFRVLYEGKPLAGTMVMAVAPDGTTRRARSDANGEVTFALGSGTWLVKTVHMIPASPDSGVAWESLWASITFAL